MRIAHVSTGAAGMLCGTCIHNNTLAKALIRLGHDATLIPMYTPLRTDEDSVAIDRVFFGAVNVYLQQSSWLFRHTPRVFDWLLDRPALLEWVSRFSHATDAKTLGAMTLAVLEGEHGPMRKELERLVVWLRDELRPDIVHLSLALFLGFAGRIRRELGVPVVCELQGEDIFFDALEEPYRSQVLDVMRRRAADVDAFIAPNRYYAELMGAELGLASDKLHVVPLGIELEGFRPAAVRASGPVRIGHLARICPEKGFAELISAFHLLAEELGAERFELHTAGHLKELDRPFFEAQLRRLAEWGLGERFTYLGEVDRQGKIDFLAGLDVFALPTLYREPKGLPALEAMACGVPVVLPRHGGFPEMLAATGGGLLVEPGSPTALAQGIRRLIDDPVERRELGRRGRAAVLAERSEEAMARAVVVVYEGLLHSQPVAAAS